MVGLHAQFILIQGCFSLLCIIKLWWSKLHFRKEFEKVINKDRIVFLDFLTLPVLSLFLQSYKCFLAFRKRFSFLFFYFSWILISFHNWWVTAGWLPFHCIPFLSVSALLCYLLLSFIFLFCPGWSPCTHPSGLLSISCYHFELQYFMLVRQALGLKAVCKAFTLHFSCWRRGSSDEHSTHQWSRLHIW